MRVEVPESHKMLDAAARSDLSRLKRGRSGRPCQSCTVRCDRCGSLSCRCNCAPSCEMAPRMLSSEPERFPIEPGIVPLVYAMAELGAVETIWSCEGHLSPDRKRLWKTPQIWFCCRTPGVAGLLTFALAGIRKHLTCGDWQVRLAPLGPKGSTVYVMEPFVGGDAPDLLPALQADVEKIAGMFPDTLKKLAGEALDEQAGKPA